jgi:hypothetical protein
VASLRTSRVGDRLNVTISGRLTSADIGRLEHACSTALTSPVAKLDIHLEPDAEMDALAARFLQHLMARGARILSSP